MFAEVVAEITTEFLIVRLDRGVGNLVYRTSREHSTVRIADIAGRVAYCVVVV